LIDGFKNRSIEFANNERTKDEGAANQNLIATLERTQKLIVLMSSVEFGESVNVAAAVPIMLTEEEQRDQIAMRVGDIDRKVQTLDTLKPKMSPQLQAKVGQSTDLAGKTKAKIGETKDLPAMESLSREALAYLDDALVLVTAEGITLSTPVTSTTTEQVATTTEEVTEAEVE
jgi:hypothetical protein